MTTPTNKGGRPDRGWYPDRTGARYVRVSVGGGKRPSFRLACETDAQADERARIVHELVDALRDAGRLEFAASVAKQGASANDEEIAALRRLVAGIVKGTERKVAIAPALGVTFADVAKRWTSGELAREYPDHVNAKRTADLDAFRLETLGKEIGDVLIADFRVEHAEAAMRKIDEDVGPATRRHYAQVMRRVLELAVYPLRLIEANPIPRGFLPKVKQSKAPQFLYPDEERTLMAGVVVAPPKKTTPGIREGRIDLGHRLLWGYLARQGFRKSEALGGDPEDDDDENAGAAAHEPIPPLTWGRLDLARGVVRMDRTKTDTASRPIPLDPGVVRALVAWKAMHPDAKATDVVFVDEAGKPISHRVTAETFRAHLLAVGVDRAELHERANGRMRIRVHDLRATFCTVKLALGKPDYWVRDRTGHKSIVMLDRYRRPARMVEELQLGDFAPLDEAIPELRAAGAALAVGGGQVADDRPSPGGEVADDGAIDSEGVDEDHEEAAESAPIVPHPATLPHLANPLHVGSNPIRTSRK